MQASPGQPLNEGDAERLIAAEMVAALDHVYGADNIAAERDRNYDYYRGIMNDLPFLKGQSSVNETTVADYIGLLKPSLLRIFTAGRNIAEYVSPKPDLHEAVRTVTRFINDVVFRKDNRGELILNDWADDALVQKVGVAMWWWEEKRESRDDIYEGIPDDRMVLFAQEIQAKQGEIVEHTAQPVVAQTQMGPMQSVVHSVKVRTTVNKSKCCIDVIPPEEFIISRDARNLEDGILKAHSTGALVGDLIAAGYDADTVNNLPTYISSQYPAQKYTQDTQNTGARDASADPMLRRVGVARGIVQCDYDGTGLKEWYFVVGGAMHAPKILDIAPYNYQIGFADFCPEPRPHTFYGGCPADRLAVLQKVGTVLTRMMLNSLYLAVAPQREVVKDWIISPDQLANQSAGASILVKQPNAIREIPIPFVGSNVLPVQEYFAARAEITTGVGRNTAGLDPDALQNQSATAAMNQQSAMQSRVEHTARIWAQGGMRKLFRGVFMCVKTFQDFPREVQIDGKPVTVDPRQWQGLEDLDVNINTGLGTGSREKDYMMLAGIEVTQKEALAQLGPDNPIVKFPQLVRTLQLKAEAAGIQNPESFFSDAKNPDGSDWRPPDPPPPQPSPDAVVNANAFVETEKIKAASHEKIEADKRATERAIAFRKQDIDAALEAEKLGIDRAKVMVDAAKVDVDAQKADGKKDEK